MKLVLYIDGSCLGNGSANARAGVGVFHEEGSNLNVSESWTRRLGLATNQRAEIYAAIVALRKCSDLKEYTELEIRADSAYVVKGVTEWMPNWKRKGWRNANKKPVANQDLWLVLDKEINTHRLKNNIKWTHVDGHSGVLGNERADKLATLASSNAFKDDAFVVEPPAKRAKVDK
jgi:ribonuclease HI